LKLKKCAAEFATVAKMSRLQRFASRRSNVLVWEYPLALHPHSFISHPQQLWVFENDYQEKDYIHA